MKKIALGILLTAILVGMAIAGDRNILVGRLGDFVTPTYTGDTSVTGTHTQVGEVVEGSGGLAKFLTFTKTNLTNNSAVDILTITLAAGGSVGGNIQYSLVSTGGTSDIQIHSGMITFACVNKGGTFTKDIDEVYLAANETSVKTAGTQADTWAMKAGDVCTVTLNMNSNLSSAVNTITGRLAIFSNKTITLN